jgi:hypothetical protein
MGSDVVVADPQHLARFGFGASVMAIPADAPIEIMQLGNVHVAVFREGDVR